MRCGAIFEYTLVQSRGAIAAYDWHCSERLGRVCRTSQQQRGNIGVGKTPAEAFERFDEAFGQIRHEQERAGLACDSRSFKMQPSCA